MQYKLTAQSFNLNNALFFSIMFLSACLLFACATAKREGVIDRSTIPEVRADVPLSVPEIRELKFHGMSEEVGHKDVHLRGQLFTKSQVGSSIQIRPCVGCLIGLRNINDTANRANLTTQQDGYFEFNGAIDFNTITVKAPNHSQLEINNLNLEHGGISTLKMILAPGTKADRYTVSKNGNDFTWSKVN